MTRLLVTGGAGFIGANFVHYWLRHHPTDRIVVLDVLSYAGDVTSLETVRDRPELRFVRGDICDTPLVESLLHDEHLETIVHFAAESHVDRSIEGPDVFVETNVVGTHSMLKAARRVWLEEGVSGPVRFHHVSTDEVYGSLGEDDPPFTETTPYAPNSPYSASKAASDHMVRAYSHTFGLPVTISNCSNNYGPYQHPEKLVSLAITNILDGMRIPVYGDGCNVRDWLHVDDHCKAIDLILSRGAVGETYNVGGGFECCNVDLVLELCEIADSLFRLLPELKRRYPASPMSHGCEARSLIRFVQDRLGHDRRYAINCNKLIDRLGYAPAVDFHVHLRNTFEWFVEHEPWWRKRKTA